MFYAINWLVSFLLLALWSVAVWGVHAASVWAVSHAGVLADGSAAAHAILVPEWLRAWMPPELMGQWQAWVASIGPWLQGALEAMPALAGAVTVAAWALWGLGALMLMVLAVGVHLLIAWAQRHRNGPRGPSAAMASAGR